MPAPVLDLPDTERPDPVIGDRAWGTDPARVAALGRAVCNGAAGRRRIAIIKHIPGHGRARADSHKALPRVDDDRTALSGGRFRAVSRAFRDALGDDRAYPLRGDR